MNPFLTIENFSQTLVKFKLGPLNLTLTKNDYLILLGPTGCGKSSLLHAIAGLTPRFDGQLKIGQKNMMHTPPEQRRVGYVVQGDNLFPHLSVAQNIAFGLRYTDHPARDHSQRVAKALNQFGLERNADQSVTTLSGGERRKTALARSLVIEPELLLLDEPLSMLDHNGRIEMLALLKMIHEQFKTTTIHVTHDRSEAWTIAQTCAVMHAGKIVQSGTVAEIFREPANRFVAQFTGCTNIYDITIQKSHLETPWGPHQLARPAFQGKGTLVLRPETIQVVRGQRNTPINGVIVSITDFGNYFEVKANITNGCDMICHVQLNEGKKLRLNDQVGLLWDETVAHFIAGESYV